MDMLTEKIDRFVSENSERLFRDISRLIAFNSVESEPIDDAPFGIGPKMALHETLKIAEELGLDTFNCDNYLGYAFIGGNGEKYIATITHVDIVPAGNGWKADPFIMRDHDGYIIGRGVLDDKGPSVVCLYALKFLKDQGVELKYPVRALIGANEETGMKDVDHYLAHYAAPLFCFSPDAEFPLICGEKGIWHAKMKSLTKTENIISINGGVAANAVPDLCEAVVKADMLFSTDSVEAVKEGDYWHLTSHGISGHASLPDGTVNANGVMVEYLLANNVVSGAEKEFLKAASLAYVHDGSALDIAAQSEGFTPLTLVSGIIGMDDGYIYITLDSRYVTTTCGAELLEKIQRKVGHTASVTVQRDAAPFYKSPDSPEIVACMEAYRTVTGDDAKPFTIGGGTYSRHFPNGVGFGPDHPERLRPSFAGQMHGAEEAASKEELLESLKVYIRTILNLEKLDF